MLCVKMRVCCICDSMIVYCFLFIHCVFILFVYAVIGNRVVIGSYCDLYPQSDGGELWIFLLNHTRWVFFFFFNFINS